MNAERDISKARTQLRPQANITLIPSGISNDCNTLLQAINSDAALTSCVQPLITATASFNPLSGANLSTSDINWSLASMCKANTGCSDSVIRTWLSRFYASCSAELTNPTTYNAQVRELYDILYVVNPLKGAVCSIDSANQQYCVNQVIGVGKNSTGPSANKGAGSAVSGSVSGSATPTPGVAASVASAASAGSSLGAAISSESASLDAGSSQATLATVITPNATTYRSTNLPFLFLQPSFNADRLCTPCTREIMVAYIKWETAVPYALGLAQSPILGGQMDLWQSIDQTCGSTYVAAINAQVGQFVGISNSSSSARSVLAAPGGGIGSAVFGAAVLAGLAAYMV
ncbi:uncharacterized protein MKK02DRAFT_26583 [Dioszegia hungarica]|uniref:Uncharacterized protein n=1 Tax=Dioszegia hungarica TaxID=4972 RepID=A0AA38HA85_9TREE|nr:uncharacterized protein MKK02DRAFT_26583 [Dioszegia hungarica]KAI9636798.1 hypothetical protein MKK02DRAFT_26583 [Dioszegia hungarica]